MLKLLVIEDHALVREGLVRLLAQIEARVQVIDRPDFESALALLDGEDEFDLILLDLALPGIDGFEVLKRIRTRNQVPVLMLTARGDDLDRIVGLELGADDYVPKPCMPRE